MFEGNRVNSRDVENAITKVEYVVLPDGKTTICLLTLDNGFTVRGEASCVDPANYNKLVGEEIALQNAKDEVWPLLGFRLADQLAHGTRIPRTLSDADAKADLAGEPRPG